MLTKEQNELISAKLEIAILKMSNFIQHAIIYRKMPDSNPIMEACKDFRKTLDDYTEK